MFTAIAPCTGAELSVAAGALGWPAGVDSASIDGVVIPASKRKEPRCVAGLASPSSKYPVRNRVYGPDGVEGLGAGGHTIRDTHSTSSGRIWFPRKARPCSRVGHQLDRSRGKGPL
jgi:hypothetical protein